MEAFHDHLSRQIREQLAKRRVLVWYDPKEEFVPFVQELRGKPGESFGECAVETVAVGGLQAHLCVGNGSLIEVKFAAEPVFGADEPEPLLVYLPGMERNKMESPLLELELAGDCRERFLLKQQARFALRAAGYSDGVIDELLASDGIKYADVVALLAERPAGEPASMLKTLFADATGNADLLADWLADKGSDAAIAEKGAAPELFKLIKNRLGLELPEGAELAEARQKTLRYVLVGEFRDNLRGEPPLAVNMIPQPANKEHMGLLQGVAKAMRARHAATYAELADGVEADLGLGAATVAAADLGAVDTFRFEEEVLLAHVGALVSKRQFAEAREIVDSRRRSFWADREVRRQQQWEACRLMAKLGALSQEVASGLPGTDEPPESWVERYTSEGGWGRMDLTQRRLEALLCGMTEEPACEQAVHAARQAYEEALQALAEGFTKALEAANWGVAWNLGQTEIYGEMVGGKPEPVAFFLVDSMRYEMGVELHNQLTDAAELNLRPAIACLPTVTPVGMAALMPEASKSFSLAEKNGKLAVRVGGALLAAWADRAKRFKSLVPGLADIELGKLLDMPSASLKRRVKGAPVILVRSQDIDEIGEGGARLARQVMDTAIGNVARAIRKLSAQGVERFVVTADHGHLYLPPREDAMRLDAPKGETVALHRRCWVGRGGATPPGAARLHGADLGYDTDLDLVVPRGLAVFRSGGDLAYHHGGASLQEMVVPVLAVRTRRAAKGPSPESKLLLSGLPEAIANRTIAITLKVEQSLFGEREVAVRPILLRGGVQVGEAGMAIDAKFDSVSRCVRLTPGKEATVAMLLSSDESAPVKVVVQDPATDAVLAESDDIPVKLGI